MPRLLGDKAAAFTEGLRPGGYHIEAVAHPLSPGKPPYLALGSDLKGAYAAGEVLCHAIHPNHEGVNTLRNWPAKIPAGCYWLPFEAKASPPEQEYEITAPPHPTPPKPLVPFGLRVGKPHAHAGFVPAAGAGEGGQQNTIVVQSGGWVDLPDAASRFVKALDITWQEGLYTCLYVGNEEAGHKWRRSARITRR